MRQVGHLTSEKDARRFVAWLTAQQIEASAEQDQASWNIWVRDEDNLTTARTALAEFSTDPAHKRYADAEKQAEVVRREKEKQREQARRNQVQMRDKWGSPSAMATRRSPLTLVLIGLCIVVALMSNLGRNPNAALIQSLQFSNSNQAYQSLRSGPPPASITGNTSDEVEASVDRYVTWYSIRRGEIWRFFTPALVHYGVMHLLFNSMILYSFGGQIETRYGTWRMLLLVLFLAALSNTGQALTTGPGFGGMSGVGYGLFGFLWMRTTYDPASGLRLDQFTVFLLLLWFAIGIGTEIPAMQSMLQGVVRGRSIANVAHAVGLVAGMAIGIPWLKFLGTRRSP